MATTDPDNVVFKIAADFINSSNHPVFLTGKAGTGKTTFLRYIKEHTKKNTVVVAPTGVAAVNAGGTTIHSFFQLPFAPFVPVEQRQPGGATSYTADRNFLAGLKLTNERKAVLEQLELLIIDEVSMVRCDVLDAIDAVLRYVRYKPAAPFGGVQVLYIGDMYQLRPVIKNEEWSILKASYTSEYFFGSHVVIQQCPVFIELKKVYRQSDPVFINLLNQVRNNEVTEEGYDLLHSRFRPDFNQAVANKFITLTTHNHKADSINEEALQKLPQRVYDFNASVSGTFAETAYPADKVLQIKTGAQVMFLKNDVEKIRRYFNGKIGVVQKIEDDKIWVECIQDNVSQLIEVKKETWRNVKYTLNIKSNKVEEEELGSFAQFPLRLAWAITIHKSQGLTFQNAVIDAGQAFAAGQVYVALSRCTSLDGIILRSKINFQSLRSDERIIEFSLRQQDETAQSGMLYEAKKRYQAELIFQLFTFSDLARLSSDMLIWIKENKSWSKNVRDWFTAITSSIENLWRYAERFHPVLHAFFSEDILPEENGLFQDRLKKASIWFYTEIEKIMSNFSSSPAVSDNRQAAKDYSTRLQKIFDVLGFKKFLFNICRAGFSLSIFNAEKTSFQKELLRVNTYSGGTTNLPKDVLHPDLYLSLLNKRQELAEDKNVAVYLVCKTQSIEEMANYLPQTLDQLAQINGFGKIKLKQFGREFLDIIKMYCLDNELEKNERFDKVDTNDSKKLKANLTSATKKISLDLYNKGKSIAEIAGERNLALATIEGHLAYFIKAGQLDIDKFINRENRELILSNLKSIENQSITELKLLLPQFSYGELRMVLASAQGSTV